MDELSVLLIVISFVIGYLIGEVNACDRGGCVWHGRDWKK